MSKPAFSINIKSGCSVYRNCPEPSPSYGRSKETTAAAVSRLPSAPLYKDSPPHWLYDCHVSTDETKVKSLAPLPVTIRGTNVLARF